MKKRIWSILVLIVITACSVNPPAGEVTGTPTISLPTPVVNVTSAPDAAAAAGAFLDAWAAEDYQSMYAMLARVSQDAISQEDFTKRYNNTAINLSLVSLAYKINSTLTNPGNAQVSYGVTYNTSMVGTLERDMVMNLEMGDGTWKILWDDGMIMPELKGGNYLVMDITVPSRGIIFDRNGEPLAAQQDAVALGVVPAEIGDAEGSLLAELSNLIDKPIAAIQNLYDDIRDANWYVPVGEASASEVEARFNVLSEFTGLWMTKYSARFYNYGGVAPHTTGYVQSIFAEEVDEYRRMGYRGDEKVGAAGIEKWGEEYLAGTRGASLLVVDPQGQIVTRLGKRDSVAAQSIYTTIDSEFQRGVQQAIAGFRGAIVVLEVDTGKVVAMASSPTFDPNSFETSNANSSYLLQDLFSSTEQPLLNRATQGGYPLGSVFKIVTMAAALETGIFNQYSSYYCGHEFTDLPGQVFYDWTYERGVAPSGDLTLPEGLMRSCNPWFYHIGLELFRQNEPDAVTEMAKGFGLGSATGIGQVAEDIGSIPYPQNEGDAVQQGIGQGAMLVTPLQVADFIAAIGNGGTLLQPQVVDKVVAIDGTLTKEFSPVTRGKLPVSPENLKIIQDAMLSVVENARGTAHRLVTTGYTIYGKTGTATNPMGKPHAWFAGYTDDNRTDRPDIAVVVLVENVGEGSEFAVPIFRRVLELYYRGAPTTLYPWESTYYSTKTPTPLYTDTPEPTETPEVTPTP
ncbi:MAG TPA: penicillin-binding transpeptidase domain-containing protein [Anaerolineaceae bacterium]|nr:penicillin-binding transpeptidase domain-containing protein [Anaerolineaceae bacterium]